MKRVFYHTLGLLIFFAVSLPVRAQRDSFAGEFYFGAGGGALFTKIDFVPGITLAFKQGMHGGISAKYISQEHLGLILEANYSQRGWKEEYDPSTGFSYDRTLNYLEFPFMTHVYAGHKTRFIFNVGPQISILLNDKELMSEALANDLEQRRNNNPDARIGMQYDGMSKLKKIDYGLIAGIGMALKTGMGDFDLEGRYYFGLGDIFSSRRSDKAYFSRSAARVAEVRLTYYFRIF